jgi:DNA-binding HxlR family transcriptional regulator
VAAEVPRPGRRVRGSSTGRPVMALFDLIGRRWMLRIVWELERAAEPLTFRALRTVCGEVSSSVLTRRLRELGAAGLVEHADGYRLTPLGRRLVTALRPVTAWAEDWEREMR